MQDIAVVDHPEVREALRGARALLLDFDGVLALAGRPIAGAPEAIAAVERLGIAYRIVTNTSLASRETLARRAARLGIACSPGRLITALSASAAWTARHLPGQPLYVLASDDARTEFAGQRLLSHDEAATPDARAAAVIVGDSPEELTWTHVNAAFRLLHRGARLVAMHRNRWWITPDGPTIDSGSYVAALEFAAATRALVIGKPSRAFFAAAVAELAAEVLGRGEHRLGRDEIVMVGDDLGTDVAGARRAGLRAIFVLSGRMGEADLDHARRRGGRAVPDAVARSLADVVASLEASA